MSGKVTVGNPILVKSGFLTPVDVMTLRRQIDGLPVGKPVPVPALDRILEEDEESTPSVQAVRVTLAPNKAPVHPFLQYALHQARSHGTLGQCNEGIAVNL